MSSYAITQGSLAANSNYTIDFTGNTLTIVNRPPDLTGFAGPVASTDENTEIEISYAELAAQGDEMDHENPLPAVKASGVGLETTSTASKVRSSKGSKRQVRPREFAEEPTIIGGSQGRLRRHKY